MRCRTGKTDYKLSPEDKEEKRQAYDKRRNIDEESLLGGYERIYPLDDTKEN